MLLLIWFPAVLWTAIIVLESIFGSLTNTGMILQSLLEWMFGDVDQERFEVFHHIRRKTGHFLGYGILGYLWFRAFIGTLQRWTPLACAALAIAFTFVVASLDEWHQSFLPDRTGQFKDVVLDVSGALVLVSLAFFTVARRRKTGPAIG